MSSLNIHLSELIEAHSGVELKLTRVRTAITQTTSLRALVFLFELLRDLEQLEEMMRDLIEDLRNIQRRN